MTIAGRGKRNVTMAAALAADIETCILWPHGLDKDGYAGMVQAFNVKRKAYIIACEHMHGPKPEGMQAAHSCGVRACVNPRHLRWATPLENNREKAAHGTVNHGERQGLHKLTEAEVIAIRDAVRDGHRKQDVARRFGVVPSNITQIVQRKTWRHV